MQLQPSFCSVSGASGVPGAHYAGLFTLAGVVFHVQTDSIRYQKVF